MSALEVAITLDVDWAPDAAIDSTAALLVAHSVKATWFVTHPSAAIDRLRAYPELFELGIHPNFLRTSTHGSNEREVLAYCLALVPDATSMRTHSLVQSSRLLLQVMEETAIERDVTTFLPYHPQLRPTEMRAGGRRLLRIPFFWDDDYEMEMGPPDWDVTRLLRPDDRLAVFNFHPIHVALNSAAMGAYRRLISGTHRYSDATANDIAAHRNPADGAETAFRLLLGYVARGGARSVRIRDIS